MYVSIPPHTVYWATRGSLEMELPLQVLCAESLVPLKTWPRLKQLRIQGNPLTFTCKGKPRESVLLFYRRSSMLDKLPHRDPSCPLLLNDIFSTATTCSLHPGEPLGASHASSYAEYANRVNNTSCVCVVS